MMATKRTVRLAKERRGELKPPERSKRAEKFSSSFPVPKKSELSMHDRREEREKLARAVTSMMASQARRAPRRHVERWQNNLRKSITRYQAPPCQEAVDGLSKIGKQRYKKLESMRTCGMLG